MREALPRLEWVSNPSSVRDSSSDPLYDLAIVLLNSADVEALSAAQLLGSLRDRHAKRVLLDDPHHTLAPSELLALGFLPQSGIEGSKRPFLHNPDEYYPEREWNNAQNWANPENFDKRRW